MAMRVRHTVMPIKSPADMARGGSRPQPPKAVAQRASLEPARAGSDHQKPKRRLTAKTVAFLRCRMRLRRAATLHNILCVPGNWASYPVNLLVGFPTASHARPMFIVNEAEAAAIRQAYEEGGEFAAAIELRRHFPGITDNLQARECARIIASWKPLPALPRSRSRGSASSHRD